MSINNKRARRLSAAMVASALTIALASCSGATNKYGSLNRNEVYASVGDYKITNGELWDELQWSAVDVLDAQITNVILNEQIDRIKKVLNTSGDYTKLEDKKIIHGSTEEITEDAFNKLYDQYKTRLVDYVVQDVYNVVYEQGNYWKKIENFTKIETDKFVQKYVDEIYTEYQKSSIADGDLKGTSYKDILADISSDNNDGLFELAKDLCELYYPLYAKELYTYDIVKDAYEEALKDDTDDDDEKYGNYTNSQYVDIFKKNYTNQFDVNMIKIKFTDNTEFADTLRAFGLYVHNDKFYYIYDDETDRSKKLDYTSYIDHYKEYKSTSSNFSTTSTGSEIVEGKVVLEIYIMLYNYMYGGYLDTLPSASGVAISFNDLNTLREQTLALINKYKVSDEDELYNNTIEELKAFDAARDEDDKVLTYKPDYLEETYTKQFQTYCYETLKLTLKNASGEEFPDYTSRYSTSLQTADDASVIVYKFDDTLDEITDEKALEYEKFYLDKDKTTIDYFEYLTSEDNKELFADVVEALLWDGVTDSIISNKLEAARDDVKVKVFTEAAEIAYSKDHSDYSKAVGKPKSKNLFATITYDKKTYNLNIKANDDDKNSVLIPGTDSAFGVYDYLEKTTGSVTAVDLLSKKIIRDTKEYQEVKKDKKNRDLYNTYVKNVLSAFANDAYSSSGYPSTLGKYNFLMLYYHTANVNKIIDDYFMTQLASSKLLTDYSDESLAEFLKTYVDYSYDKYFSLSGKRLIIYIDADEDGYADDAIDWINDNVENWTAYDGTVMANASKEYIAKQLAYTIYNKVSASANSSHATRIEELVNEFNNSAKAEYNDNPAAKENVWARYKKLGFIVELSDISATNSSVGMDYQLKQRMYDYARGHNEDNTREYQFFINDNTPTEYIEPLTVDSISVDNDDIITSKDGVNLLVITQGTPNSSAKWSIDDHDETLLRNIIIKYNEQYIKIDNIFNEEDRLNENQILLYVLDNAVNSASTLSPSSISDSLTSYLSPVYTRYTSAETQRIILLYFIKTSTNSDKEIHDVITFANENYNGDDGYFKNIIVINQNKADNYSALEQDTTNTSDLYPDWWEKLEQQVKNFLIDQKEDK